jgi:hypothetical protein
MGLRGRRRGGSAAGAATGRAARRERRVAAKAGKRGGSDGGEPTARSREPLTAKRAKRMIGVGTTVAPLLAPYAMAAAGAARARWDAHRATRLGVAPEELSAYSGRGGALHARMSRIAEALTEFDPGSGVHATAPAQAFAERTRPRLADLAVAVRAAEQMPAPRRRTAFRAIGAELDRVEAELLTHLGVTV